LADLVYSDDGRARGGAVKAARGETVVTMHLAGGRSPPAFLPLDLSTLHLMTAISH